MFDMRILQVIFLLKTVRNYALAFEEPSIDLERWNSSLYCTWIGSLSDELVKFSGQIKTPQIEDPRGKKVCIKFV